MLKIWIKFEQDLNIIKYLEIFYESSVAAVRIFSNLPTSSDRPNSRPFVTAIKICFIFGRW